MNSNRTDKERLDFLQFALEQREYTGDCIMRISNTGRGWRLHETDRDGATDNVREAIDNFIDSNRNPAGKGVNPAE